MNDEAIPAYVTVDTSIGYRLPSVGLKSRPELKLNLINLNQGDYLSSVATPTTNAQTAITRNGVVVPGVAPAYYLSAGFSAIASLRQNF
jgi:iron complex outermembrane receptor protein